MTIPLFESSRASRLRLSPDANVWVRMMVCEDEVDLPEDGQPVTNTLHIVIDLKTKEFKWRKY